MTTNYVNEIEKQGIKYGGYYMRIQKKNIVKLLSILLTVLLLLGSVVTVSADEKTDADAGGAGFFRRLHPCLTGSIAGVFFASV